MAQAPVTQQRLLDLLQDGQARYQRLIMQLNDEEQQTAFTPQGWSTRDFLAHTAHWKAATHKLVVAYIHDQPLPPETPSGDEANAEAREADKELSLPQVRNYWEETHQMFTHLVADDLDDNRLLEEAPAPWDQSNPQPLGEIMVSICEHDAEHFELMEQYFEVGREPA